MSVVALGVAAVVYVLVERIVRNDDAPLRAVCVFDSNSSCSSIDGEIVMTRECRGQTRFACELRGLTPGLHGFHVHEYGDLRGEACSFAGAHFNPRGETHGDHQGGRRHEGDLGNLVADERGVCSEIITASVDLSAVLGRALVVHANADDLGGGSTAESHSSGTSGARIACAVIGIADRSKPVHGDRR